MPAPPIHYSHPDESVREQTNPKFVGKWSTPTGADPINFAKKKSKLVGKIYGQILTQIAHVRGGLGVRFRTTGKEGKGKGGHTLSAGEASDEELETAAPLPCRRRLQRRRPTAERVSETRGERGGTSFFLSLRSQRLDFISTFTVLHPTPDRAPLSNE